MTTERIKFPGASGDMLAARLDLPHGAVLGTALFAHCFTCSKDSKAARRISARLAAMGLAVLRFDFTGLGQSGGAFEQTTFTSTVGDLVAAAGYLADNNMAPSLIIGHSLGGAAALMAAGKIDSVKAVVSIGAPFDPAHVTHNFKDALDNIARDGVAEVQLGGRPIRVGQSFVEDVNAVTLDKAIGSLHKALLVLHAPRDTVVGIENAANIFGAAKHPKSFVTLDDADHLITDEKDAEYTADVIAAWASRYIVRRPPAPPIGAPEGIIRASEADRDGFLQDITAGPYHHVLADEPAAYGGTNRGMSPYGFLSAGLGACTSMTIRMYARRKGWPLEHVSVDVTHNKVHAQDASHAQDRIDSFERLIHLTGPLDDDQRARLLQIADKCPVHRTLETGAKVLTKLA